MFKIEWTKKAEHLYLETLDFWIIIINLLLTRKKY